MTATEDLFTPIHKATRSMIYSLSGRLQSADFGDKVASADVLADLQHEFSSTVTAAPGLSGRKAPDWTRFRTFTSDTSAVGSMAIEHMTR